MSDENELTLPSHDVSKGDPEDGTAIIPPENSEPTSNPPTSGASLGMVTVAEQDTEEESVAGGAEKDDENEQSLSQDDESQDETMALFKYIRIFGTLPRRQRPQNPSHNEPVSSPLVVSPPLAFQCTCSVMGKVILSPETVDELDRGEQNMTSTARMIPPPPVDLWERQPISIMALGMQDGGVWLLEAMTGTAIVGPDQLCVRDTGAKEPIVDVSMDASGTVVAAMDAGGVCMIWEIKYALEMVPAAQQGQTSSPSPRSNQQPAEANNSSSVQQDQGINVFSSFMSAFTGNAGLSTMSAAQATSGPRTADGREISTANSTEQNGNDDELDPQFVPVLKASSIQSNKVAYPKSFGPPTCLVIDPAYKRRQQKSVVTGFVNGRLVLTKRGFFQRRNDSIVYQAVVESKDRAARGIEAIVWRGSLLGCADATGLRLFETESWQRIALMDRPTGARPSLYPTISALKPSICFETSTRILVAWGDCLLGLEVQDVSVQQAPASGSGAMSTSARSDGVGASSSGVRRLTLVHKMAWKLDCVAVGVAPLDEEHVMVLGLVPPVDENGDPLLEEGEFNDVELQVLSRQPRTGGNVVYSDMLPLVRPPLPTKARGRSDTSGKRVVARRRQASSESALPFTLLSSFVVPRMDDAFEQEEEVSNQNGGAVDPLQASLFGVAGVDHRNKAAFQDYHQKWDLGMIAYEDSEGCTDERASDDTDSVDSDEYAFPLHPKEEADDIGSTSGSASAGGGRAPSKPPVPPVMVVMSGYDVVLARTRNVDDAISFSLSNGKAALALRRALRRPWEVSSYDIDDLVNEYFRALLRLPEADEDDGNDAKDSQGEGQPTEDRSPLSLRRMKLAAEVMPVLLGGNVGLWELWVSEMEKIPGALFVVRGYLPVRDPILPKRTYAGVLIRMLDEVQEMKESSNDEESSRLTREAEGHFLNSLIAWGTTFVLKEYEKLYTHQQSVDPSYEVAVQAVEECLNRRYSQTAAGYLAFRRTTPSTTSEATSTSRQRDPSNDTKDSLYNVNDLIDFVTKRLSLFTNDSSDLHVPTDLAVLGRENSRVTLDALARLHMMQGSFEATLRCFLIIGSLHSTRTLAEVEEEALAYANDESPPQKKFKAPYSFLLLLIENHHLHQYLLDAQYLPKKLETPPLFALLRLFSLDLVGDFLIEHCVAPQMDTKQSSSGLGRYASAPLLGGGERRGTLPLDLVVEQLEVNPRLLYWYLQLVFLKKSDVYVKFPKTSTPPPIIDSLHRKHVDLLLKFAGPRRDSSKVLEGVEAYRVAEQTTPLLSFLKVILQLGGISPVEVAKLIEVERKGGNANISRTFAIEFAYILEHYGDGSINDAKMVLDLYLKGAKSLMLAVSYTQRTTEYSSILWETLVDYCLSVNNNNNSNSNSNNVANTTPIKSNINNSTRKKVITTTVDGTLFGSLLEAAALNGADVSNLVKQIPHGMSIEGLRPRLVAAVADYRFKLEMQQSSSKIACMERNSLLCEAIHRSKRGTYISMKVLQRILQRRKGAVSILTSTTSTTTKFNNSSQQQQQQQEGTDLASSTAAIANVGDGNSSFKLRRTKIREGKHTLSYTLPLR